MLEKKNSIIIVGCGFLGKAAASLFSSQGYSVLGIARNPITEDYSKEHAFSLLSCDITNPSAVEALREQIPPEAFLIYSVSSGKGGSDTYGAVYREGFRRVLETWKPKQALFVSSTSVYGQAKGETVTESSPTEPDRETGRILLEAEKIALASGGLVARLSGIYGPGRSVLLQKFLEGTAILENGGTRFINQIHRDDAAAALFHLVTTSAATGIYNVTDDTPATQQTVYSWIAEALHKPLPHSGPADLNRKRGWTSKRISNQKLRATGWIPQFPSYREALPELLDDKSF
ncbi:MAG: NAD-dependent epimerase/dehydratase family protein [Chthoniobacterales bacterium]